MIIQWKIRIYQQIPKERQRYQMTSTDANKNDKPGFKKVKTKKFKEW